MSKRILIDPQAFTAERGQIQGKVRLQDLDERVHSADFTDLSSEVAYKLQGGKDKWQRPFLRLSLSGSLSLQCQRCMEAVMFPLDESADIVLFGDEAMLDEAMCADEELEGMVAGSELDVSSLLEDQILMSLPYSPMHEDCGGTVAGSASDKPNPFAVLAGLEKSD